MTYYLSGPISGIDNQNWDAFERAEFGIRALGHGVVNPLKVQDGIVNWEEAMRADLIALLKDCDGIVLLDGWPTSKGAGLELTVALALGLPVYLWHDGQLLDVNTAEGNR